MRLSRYFAPTLRETPAEAQIVSHQLMLRAGLVRQTAAGIYSWLPLGLRVLRNIERIVREEQDRAGALEILMPTIQTADHWRESGRYDAYGPEMLRMKDRHDRDILFSPTAEELFTHVFKDGARSYRDLPRTLYQIQWKFRDEVRPRFGVMRGREFLMKDAYSFDLDGAGGAKSYEAMFRAYLRTFAVMGLKAVPVRAPTGPIGGDLSHEFQIVADTGESAIYYDAALDEIDATADDAADRLRAIYAMEEEEHAKALCPVPPDRLIKRRGIEVGHIFFFGDKYTRAAGMTIQTAQGEQVHPLMGSYGIGISRLVGAIIEASHDAAGIVWPDAVAPFRLGIINLRADDTACTAAADSLHDAAQAAGVEVLYDDRDERGGAKFAAMDLIGLPWVATVGPRGAAAGMVELKRRATGEKHELSTADVVARVMG